MGGSEEMDMRARKQYRESLVERYIKADRRGKGEILDEYCRNTGQNRKYVIRKMGQSAFQRPRLRKKRSVQYGPDVKIQLVKLWQLFDYPCGQRLQPIVRAELHRLCRQGSLRISEGVRKKLLRMGSATMDRLLRQDKKKWVYERTSTPARTTLLHRKNPLRMTDWDTAEVGNTEIDLVLHCGASGEGEFLHTLTTLDIATGWWEAEAIMGRAQERTFAALRDIRLRSPVRWISMDSDNDTAFINNQLYRYCTQEKLLFTRSRPYRKNDNAYIEQKNYTHVRKPLGYLRYDTAQEQALINDLYRNELRLFKNFFQPVMKLTHKQRIDGRIKRKYDVPQTPYQRLLAAQCLSRQAAQKLRRLYESLDPVALKASLDEKLNRLFALYHEKKKSPVTVNPYKKRAPSVTSFVIQKSPSRLPGLMI